MEADQSRKDSYRRPVTPRRIESIQFSTLSSAEIIRVSELQVTERNLYKIPSRNPASHGILDRRMGTTDKSAECHTCGNKMLDCAGHFGYIKLELPVFHIGYFKNVVSILQCVCKSCSNILLNEEDKRAYLRKFRHPRIEAQQKKLLVKAVSDKCKRTRFCPVCGDYNGVVKKSGSTLRIVHEKYSSNPELLESFIDDFDEAISYNKEIKQCLHRLQIFLNPIRVLDIFKRINVDDLELLDISGSPENLIMTHVVVPPVCIRPSVDMEVSAGTNEDDITMKLLQIVELNNNIRMGIEKGLPMSNLIEHWDFLQLQCAMLINSDLPGIPTSVIGKPLRGFVQRLKGKQGRFRGNLSGKRVDFTARTVISPDPNVDIDQVCVPIQVAKTLTFPERVSKYNIERLRKNVRNGVNRHPGANFIISEDRPKCYLKFGDRFAIAADLKEGDIVERHLEDGDIVLFNRQPSLHRMSIMAHRAKIMPWRTFRFNECVCAPYNADFDGDEMNLHLPQTEEARAEAFTLLGVHHNLATPKNGEVLISATQDFLTASYLITCKDQFYDRATFAQLCSYMFDAKQHIDLPTPTVLKPVELWTGKQVFSVLIRSHYEDRVFVTLELAEKGYCGKDEYMCPNDGYVYIHNSELLVGRLGKGTLGGSKKGLFSALLRNVGSEAAASRMNRLARLSARYIGDHGFSIGIGDVTPDPVLQSKKEQTVRKGYIACDSHIRLFRKGQLTLQPGCNADQTLEAVVTGELNKIREEAGKVCQRNLHPLNAPLCMAMCGAKGSTINISQMIACVGQQAVGGQRITNGFYERTLPHFHKGSREPAARGFVVNSFFSGLTPTEFFFHTMGGREGLVDTAVKTAETGYMSRRLMKALEDLSSTYDGTVRSSSGSIIQFIYGDDGLDPSLMEGKDSKPVNFASLVRNIKSTWTQIADDSQDSKPFPLLPHQMNAKIEELFSKHNMTLSELTSERSHGLRQFGDDLRNILLEEAERVEENAKRLSIDYSILSDGRVSWGEAAETALKNGLLGGLSNEQVCAMLDICCSRFSEKKIEPGSAVGAVGAQSIGEPGTQMTLKTFHFAGVASMNITLGVPRLKEIINAAKKISTPIITVKLVSETDVKAARIVKGRLEKTLLGEIVRSFEHVINPEDGAYIEIRLDLDVIQALQLDIDVVSVMSSIIKDVKMSRMKIKAQNIDKMSEDVIVVHPPPGGVLTGKAAKGVDARSSLYFSLHALRAHLPNVIVKGIPSVERAVINDKGNGTYNLLVEGTDFLDVLTTPGVDFRHTTTNHVIEADRFLGIEAARQVIINEVNYTMGSHGMSIDPRHVMLLADEMTFKGDVLGITRFGIAKMKDSVLMLASFEKTTDHLFEAALHGRNDLIQGVSECIIMGVPMLIGSGSFRVLHDHTLSTPTSEKWSNFQEKSLLFRYDSVKKTKK